VTVWGVIRLVAGAGMIVVLGAATLMLWPLLWPPDPDTTVQLVNGRLVGETSGYVGRIDLDARTVDVSSSLVGWRPVVLVVNDQTAIQLQDRRGDIGDLVKDTPVRAFYEVVGDRRLAKSIEVVTDESGRAGGAASDAGRTPPSQQARPETEGTPGPSAPASAAGMPPADVAPAAGATASPAGTIVKGPGGVAPPRASAAAAPPVTGPAPPATSAPPPSATSAPPPPAVTIPSVPPQPVQRVEPAVPKVQAQLPEKRPEPTAPAAAGATSDKRVEPVAPRPPATTPPKPPPAAPEKRAEAAAPEKRPEAAAPRPASSGEKRPESSVAPTPPAPRQDADRASPRQDVDKTSPPRVAPQPPESDPGDGSAAVDWLLKRGR